jgi:hypothetical protein
LSEFIFMLTLDDETIPDALAVYREVRDIPGLRYLGFKDIGLPEAELQDLADEMRAGGHETMLEVISLTEADELRAVEVGLRLGVDYLIGGTRPHSVWPLLRGTSMRYFPYVGEVIGHPAALAGEIDAIVDEACELEALGVDGINLLSFRYVGDPLALTRAVKKAISIPLICAGSVDSVSRVSELSDLDVWAFTIGGAVIQNAMAPEPGVRPQVSAVLAAALDGRSPQAREPGTAA